MQKVRNKWNGKLYDVLEENQDKVTLKREDGKQFTIQKSELLFNYYSNNFEKIKNNG